PDSLVSVSASISGEQWQADSAFAYRVTSSGNDSTVYNLLINATQYGNPAKTISFTIGSFSGTGTYSINPPNVTATYYSGSVRHFATSGQVVVTNTTYPSLIGTFSFTADTITITSGSFNVVMP